MTADQISLSMSPMGGSIARFAAIRRPDQAYGKDTGACGDWMATLEFQIES